MSLAADAIAAITGAGFEPAQVAEMVVKYGPALLALVQLIEQERDAEKRAALTDELTRGMQFAKETGDTSQTENALRAHCNSVHGCRL